MAFIYEYYSNSYWSQNDPGVKTKIGIKNSGSSSVVVKKVYVQNRISNYQEQNCIENFCIHLSGSSNFGGGSSDLIINYDIPYPNYYIYSPGNIEYEGLGVLPSYKFNYKNSATFTLTQNQLFSFYLHFNPRNRKIDFYKADLIVDYEIAGESITRRFTHKIRANYLNSIDSVDGISFPTIAIEINGISSSGILTIQ